MPTATTAYPKRDEYVNLKIREGSALSHVTCTS
jgi:hypothetical protein